MGRADFDKPRRCLETVLCLILCRRPREGEGLAQGHTAAGADLAAWGPGRCPTL